MVGSDGWLRFQRSRGRKVDQASGLPNAQHHLSSSYVFKQCFAPNQFTSQGRTFADYLARCEQGRRPSSSSSSLLCPDLTHLFLAQLHPYLGHSARPQWKSSLFASHQHWNSNPLLFSDADSRGLPKVPRSLPPHLAGRRVLLLCVQRSNERRSSHLLSLKHISTHP